uniref:Uncharacterized protein MANES_04G023700 n=1 Tax=Rhizophora mucronata TaxID=61149 RepID=A0A2P2JJ26_RHIMU
MRSCPLCSSLPLLLLVALPVWRGWHLLIVLDLGTY